jgi:hypothetical protein
MRLKIHMISGCALLAMFVTLSLMATGQQRREPAGSRAIAYDAEREIVLQGTVLGYTENSPVPPIGAHATVQTANGIIDVHLGPAPYLHAYHFSFVSGDSVRLVGTISRQNKNVVFLARVAQKGSQAIAIRSTQGFLLARGAPRCMSKEQRAQAQEEGPR